MNLEDIEARWPEGRLANSDAREDVLALIARVRELDDSNIRWAEAWNTAECNGLHTDGTRELCEALGIRKMTADGVARHALQRIRELETECERMKTFAAQNFSAMIRQEAEQMRAYGLSYEGVRKVLHEYNDGEISFGKLMDLIRAAARTMAEDSQRAASNLLAIIHGDGGHYENAHGTVKACKDAEGVVSDLRLRLDAATYKLSGCQCQWEAGDSPCPVHGDDEK